MKKVKTDKQLLNAIKKMARENDRVLSSDILDIIKENEKLKKKSFEDELFTFIVEGDVNDLDYINHEVKFSLALVVEAEELSKKLLSLYEELEDDIADVLDDAEKGYLTSDEIKLFEIIVPVESCSGIPVHTLTDFELKNNSAAMKYKKEADKLEKRLNAAFANNSEIDKIICLYSDCKR